MKYVELRKLIIELLDRKLDAGWAAARLERSVELISS